MGPRFFKRGDDASNIHPTLRRDTASMGPRFFKRGDRPQPCGTGRFARASMGPRFFKRGDQCGELFEIAGRALQWGHASLSVETSSNKLRLQKVGTASMGPRFFKRGDQRYVSRTRLLTISFNGATLL